MNFEERIDAMAMNLELTAREIADLRHATDAFQRNTEAFRQETAQRFAQWELQSRHADEMVADLLKSTQMLLTVAQSHENRLTRLER